MTNIAQAQLYIYDMLNLAQQIEEEFEPILPSYPEGYYLPNMREPVMKANHYYYRRQLAPVDSPSKNWIDVPVLKKEDIVEEVYDSNGEVVVPYTKLKLVTTMPTLPYYGMDMITIIVNHIIDHSHPFHKEARPSLAEQLSNGLADWFKAANSGTDPTYLQDKGQQIADMAIDLRTDLVNFIGKDKWAMYHVRPLGHTGLIIERGEDFRIMDWERRMASGEWKNE